MCTIKLFNEELKQWTRELDRINNEIDIVVNDLNNRLINYIII